MSDDDRIEENIIDLLPDDDEIDGIKTQFNLPISRNSKESIIESSVDDGDSDLEQDFKRARKKIFDTIEIASEAIEEMRIIAEQSGHPKAYEVLNQYIKSLSKISKDLVELHKLKNDSKAEKKEGTENGNTTNNNLILMSTTAELQKMLKEMKNED